MYSTEDEGVEATDLNVQDEPEVSREPSACSIRQMALMSFTGCEIVAEERFEQYSITLWRGQIADHGHEGKLK